PDERTDDREPALRRRDLPDTLCLGGSRPRLVVRGAGSPAGRAAAVLASGDPAARAAARPLRLRVVSRDRAGGIRRRAGSRGAVGPRVLSALPHAHARLRPGAPDPRLRRRPDRFASLLFRRRDPLRGRGTKSTGGDREPACPPVPAPLSDGVLLRGGVLGIPLSPARPRGVRERTKGPHDRRRRLRFPRGNDPPGRAGPGGPARDGGRWRGREAAVSAAGPRRRGRAGRRSLPLGLRRRMAGGRTGTVLPDPGGLAARVVAARRDPALR